MPEPCSRTKFERRAALCYCTIDQIDGQGRIGLAALALRAHCVPLSAVDSSCRSSPLRGAFAVQIGMCRFVVPRLKHRQVDFQ